MNQKVRTAQELHEAGIVGINSETATIDELRAYVMHELGNADVFDACATDAAKRNFVADFIEECAKQDAAEEDYYDRIMRGD